MHTTTRLVLYGGLLVAAFAAAAGVGLAVGPIDTGDTATHDQHDLHGEPSPPARAGTSLDADGVRFAPNLAIARAGRPVDYSFRLVDTFGTPLTEFVTNHERDLHLIVSSRDLSQFHHLHPSHDGRGTWSVDLPPLPEGTYRVFADAQPVGADPVTLGADLVLVEGEPAADPMPPASTDRVAGYDVTLTGDPVAGGTTLTFTVERDGVPVATEPYLGAAGHLVVLRAGDLAYVHAHAEEAGGDRTIGFDVSFPTAGTYRLFLDVAIAGEVHTADFTVRVPDPTTPSAAPAATTDASHGDH